MKIANFRNKPIRSLDTNRSHKDYRSEDIDVDSKESKEPLIDIREYGVKGHNYYNREDNWYGIKIPGSIPQLYLRKSITQSILKLNKLLKKEGMEVYIYDAWRPIEVQKYLYHKWFPNWVRKNNPKLSESEIMKKVSNYCAKPPKSKKDIDYQSPPPHSTGAVVDATLINKYGHILFMGTIFDDITQKAHPDYFEKLLEKSEIEDFTASDREALQNRRMLYHAFEQIGFVTNPTEYWHSSFGDQLWSKFSKKKAFYSYIEPK